MPCQRQVFKVEEHAAYDYRADPMLFNACEAEATQFCPDVKAGGGRVQGCLVRPPFA